MIRLIIRHKLLSHLDIHFLSILLKGQIMKIVKPTETFPEIQFKLMSGEIFSIGDRLGHWVMLIVYRGDHCPRCKTYMKHLHELEHKYLERGVGIIIATMDPEHIVQRTISENNWTLPVAHSLSENECRQLALYLTPHAEGGELTGIYAEPGLFLINPQGQTQVIATSNSPSVRPDLDVVLDGIIGTQERNLPIRGTHT